MIRNTFLLFFILISSLSYSSEIKFKGLSKLTPSDLNSLTSVDINNKNISIDDINILIKDLYNSDLITNVSYEKSNENFIVFIEESLFIEKIYINGNIKIKDELILSNISSKENFLFNKNQIISDIEILERIYLSEGFRDAEINIYSEKYSTDRINLIIDINEQSQSSINKIDFIGNNFFSNKLLYSLISTKVENFYNIFSSGSNFDISQFNFDINKIISFYKDHGFFDVQVSYELDKNSLSRFSLKYYILENERYKLNNFEHSFKSEIYNDFFKNEIDLFKAKLDKNKYFYDREIIENHLQKMNEILSNNNIQNSNINSELEIKDNELLLNFFDVPSIPTRINKINIFGNSITKERVIRSRLSFEPGDFYNEYNIKKSKKQLLKTRYINAVEINEIRLNDQLDIDINLEENTKTGNFLFGGSVSGDTGIGLMLSLKDYNFLGSGNEINSSFNLNSEKTLFKVDYSMRPISNTNLKNTFSIYNSSRDLTGSFGYKTDEQGLGYGIAFNMTEKTSVSSAINYSNNRGYSAKNNNSSVTDNIGNFSQFTFDFNITNDNRDDFLYPSDGYKNSLNIELSPNYISDDAYVKLRLKNENYFKISNSSNFIFFNNNLGLAESLDDKLKTVNAFSLGGLNFKGFDYRGIGPFNDNIYLGGNKSFTSTLGYGSSFIFDEKDNINIKIFSTIGSVWDSDYTNNNEFKLRSSAGVSFDILTVVGPISLSYSVPIDKQDDDKSREFNFSIGTSF